MEAREGDFNRNSDVLISRQRLRIVDIQKNAKDDNDGALKVALDEADNRAESILMSLRTSGRKRHRLIHLATGWLDQAKRYERERSMRLLHQQAERDRIWKTSLATLNFSLSRQQQACALCLRKEVKAVLEGARVVVAQLVDEKIRRKREAAPDVANSFPDEVALGRVDGTAASAVESAGEDQEVGLSVPGTQSGEGDQNIRGGSPNDAGGTKLTDTNLNGDKTSSRGPASLRPTPSPSLGGDRIIDASAILAAAEASLLVGVTSWGRDAESQVRNWTNKLLSDATCTEAEERQTTDSEGKALRSAFRAAQGEAVQAFSQNWRDPPTVSAENLRNAAEAGNDATHQSDADVECLPAFVTAERQECARLWFTLEQALGSRLLDVAQRAGSGLREDAQGFGEGAMTYAENLKSALRDVLDETKANGRSELEEIVTAGKEKLESAFALIEGQLAAARKGELADTPEEGAGTLEHIASAAEEEEKEGITKVVAIAAAAGVSAEDLGGVGSGESDWYQWSHVASDLCGPTK